MVNSIWVRFKASAFAPPESKSMTSSTLKEMLGAWSVTDAEIEQKRLRGPRLWSPFFVEPPLRPEPH